MFNARQLLVSGVLCGALAACGESPTASGGAELRNTDSPRFVGQTLGSGHRDDSESTTAAISMETTAGDSTALERGGHTLGSGH